MKQTNIETQVINARCPRCGYDLRGIMEAWENACDISGTCSECGLEYEWGDLLNPKRNMPKWCAEYAAGRGLGFFVAIMQTLLMMLRPWRFWRELRMYHLPHWRKLALLHLCLLAGIYFVLVINLGFLVIANDEIWDQNTNITNVTASRIFVVSKTMLLPLSSRSPGTYDETWAAVISDQNPSGFVVSTNRIPSPLRYTRYYLRDWISSMAPGVLMLAQYFLLCPVFFLSLPQSRRQAKVRWAHIARIFTYSLVLVWVLFYYTLFAASVMGNASFQAIQVIEGTLIGLYIALFVGGFIWWSLATSRYLKMRHPWGVGLAVVVMATLGVMLMNTYLMQDS